MFLFHIFEIIAILAIFLAITAANCVRFFSTAPRALAANLLAFFLLIPAGSALAVMAMFSSWCITWAARAHIRHRMQY